MNRIYSNYSDIEKRIIEQMATEQGLTLAAFQKYCVMLYANQKGNTTELSTLIEKAQRNLKNMTPGTTFIVSSLLPKDWPSLSRNDKMTISLMVKKYVEDHSSEFKINKKLRSNINQYLKL